MGELIVSIVVYIFNLLFRHKKASEAAESANSAAEMVAAAEEIIDHETETSSENPNDFEYSISVFMADGKVNELKLGFDEYLIKHNAIFVKVSEEWKELKHAIGFSFMRKVKE